MADQSRAEKYAKWIVENKDKKGTPEFAKVEQAYRAARNAADEPVPPQPRGPEVDAVSAKAPTPTGFVGGLASTAMQMANEPLAAVQGVRSGTQTIGGDQLTRAVGEYTETDRGPAVKVGGTPNAAQIIPFDPETQYVLRDSNSGKMLVYERNENVEEGKISSLARLANSGLLTNFQTNPNQASKLAAPSVQAGNALESAGLPNTPMNRGAAPLLRAATEQSIFAAPWIKRGRDVTARAGGETGAKAVGLYGEGQGAFEAGDAVRASVERFSKNGARALADKAYADFDRAMPEGVYVPINNLRGVLSGTKFESSALQGLFDNPAMASMGEKLKDVRALSFDDVKKLRSQIGEKLNSFSGPGDTISNREYRQLYRALSQDLEKALPTPALREQFQAANKEFSELAALNTRLRGKLLGVTSAKTPEAALDTIERALTGQGNRTLLADLRKSLAPKEYDELASSLIAKIGEPSKAAPEALKDAGFDVIKFSKSLESADPESLTLMFGSKGNTNRDFIDTIIKAGRTLEGSKAYTNWSNTAGAYNVLNLFNQAGQAAANLGAGAAVFTADAWMPAISLAVAQGGLMAAANRLTTRGKQGIITAQKLAEKVKKKEDIPVFINRLRLLANQNAELAPLLEQFIEGAKNPERPDQ